MSISAPAPPLADVWAGLSTFKATPFPPDYPANVKHLFSPTDQVHEAFVALVGPSDLTSLAASMYGWDDQQISDLFQHALLDENVPVVLCLDSTQAAGAHEKAILAAYPGTELGNQVVIGHSVKHAINHDKLIVVNGLLTICGSTNLSTGGESAQNNEAAIVYDRAFAAEAANRIALIHSEMAAQMAAAAAGQIVAAQAPAADPTEADQAPASIDQGAPPA